MKRPTKLARGTCFDGECYCAVSYMSKELGYEGELYTGACVRFLMRTLGITVEPIMNMIIDNDTAKTSKEQIKSFERYAALFGVD